MAKRKGYAGRDSDEDSLAYQQDSSISEDEDDISITTLKSSKKKDVGGDE